MMRRRVHWPALALALLMLFGIAGESTRAETARSQEIEYQVKAGFLYNFFSFVTWPDDPTGSAAPWRIGVLDDGDAFALISASLHGKLVGKHPLEVSRLSPDSIPGDLRVLFITRHVRGDPAALLAAVGKQPVLVIGETPGFARDRGTIGFVQRGANLRFEINLVRAQDVGLAISGRLAGVAEIVRSKP